MATELRSPQFQIYLKVFSESLALGYETYDYLPDDATSLPFVYIGEQFDVDTANKSTVTGLVSQTIHIYGSMEQRDQVYKMANNLRTVIRRIRKTDNFDISVREVSGQILPDNSTTTALLHGIVEVEFKFN